MSATLQSLLAMPGGDWLCSPYQAKGFITVYGAIEVFIAGSYKGCLGALMIKFSVLVYSVYSDIDILTEYAGTEAFGALQM